MSVSRFTGAPPGSFGRRLDEEPAVLLAHAVGAQWLVGGRRERFAGAQAEVREMSWADDLAVLHLGSLERFTIVRAAVLDRVQLGTAAHDDQVLALQRHGERRRLADRVGGTHIDPRDTHTNAAAVRSEHPGLQPR